LKERRGVAADRPADRPPGVFVTAEVCLAPVTTLRHCSARTRWGSVDSVFVDPHKKKRDPGDFLIAFSPASVFPQTRARFPLEIAAKISPAASTGSIRCRE
jgi:hypothetical protein